MGCQPRIPLPPAVFVLLLRWEEHLGWAIVARNLPPSQVRLASPQVAFPGNRPSETVSEPAGSICRYGILECWVWKGPLRLSRPPPCPSAGTCHSIPDRGRASQPQAEHLPQWSFLSKFGCSRAGQLLPQGASACLAQSIPWPFLSAAPAPSALAVPTAALSHEAALIRGQLPGPSSPALLSTKSSSSPGLQAEALPGGGP